LKELGAGRWGESVETLPQLALELIGTHVQETTPPW
jgi:hypothetical protein